MKRMLLIVLILVFILPGCQFAQENQDIVQSLAERDKVRDMVYEYAPSRFAAYRKQLYLERKRVIDERWEVGLKINSEDGKIILKKVRDLKKLYEEKLKKLSLAIAKQALAEKKLDRLIMIDKRITELHKRYMMAGMSAEARAALRDNIISLANEAAAEYSKMKKLKEEMDKLKDDNSELQGTIDELTGEGEEG